MKSYTYLELTDHENVKLSINGEKWILRFDNGNSSREVHGEGLYDLHNKLYKLCEFVRISCVTE